MTETLSSRDFRAHLSEVIDRATAGNATVVTRNGRAVGAFVPIEVLERARQQDEEELRRLIEERRNSPTLSLDEVMAETLERGEQVRHGLRSRGPDRTPEDPTRSTTDGLPPGRSVS